MRATLVVPDDYWKNPPSFAETPTVGNLIVIASAGSNWAHSAKVSGVKRFFGKRISRVTVSDKQGYAGAVEQKKLKEVKQVVAGATISLYTTTPQTT